MKDGWLLYTRIRSETGILLRLIKNYQMKNEDMDKLQLAMEVFNNVEDESWDVRKA